MAKLPGLNIEMGLDHTNVTKSMKSLKSEISLVNSEMRKNMSAFDYSERSAQKYQTRLDGLEKKLKIQGEVVKNAKKNLSDMSEEFGENSEQAKKAERQLNNAEAQYNNLERSVDKAKLQLEEFNKEQDVSENKWTQWGKKLDTASDKMNRLGNGMRDIGRNMSVAFTAPIVGAFTMGTKAAVDWESALAGVNKTIADTDNLDVIADGIRDMSKELPVAATEIAGVTELAQQLGVSGEENVLTFTRAIIDMGESTNMSREQAAEQMAKFANIMGMPISNVNELGSTIVALGNNYATTESDIMNMGMRLAGMGKLTGMTESDVMALATTMSSLGVEAESGGTAMTQVMNKMSNAVADGGEDLQAFASAAGVSSEEFAKAFNDRPIEALTMLIKGLEESGMSAGEMNQVLGDLGIKGIREADSIKRLVGSSEMLTEATKLSTDAFEEGNALKDEAAVRYETMASKIQTLKNKLTDIGIEIGEILMPYVEKAIDFMGNLAEKFSNMSDKTQKLIVVFSGIVAAIGPLLALGGTLLIWTSSVVKAFGALSTSIGTVGTLAKTLGAALGALTSPVSLTILAIGGLATAFGIAYAKSETFRDVVHRALSGIMEIAMIVKDAVVGFAQELFNKIREFWTENGEQVMEAFKNSWNMVLAAVEFVSPAIELLFKGLMLVIQLVWENIKGIITGALDVIMGTVQIFTGVFTGDFSKMWEGVKQLFVGAIKVIWNVFSLLFYGRIIKSVGSLVKIFSGSIKGLWTKVVGFFKNMFTGSVQQVTNLYNRAISLSNLIRSGMSNAINGAKTRVVNLFSSMRKNSVEQIKKIVDGVKGMPGKMKDALIAGKDKVVSGVKSLGNSMANTLGKVVNGVIGGINTVMSKIGISKSLSTWDVPQFSTGTNGQGSPSGKLTRNGQIAMDTLAVVGDKGPGNGKGTRELVHYPNGQVGLYDDDAMIFAPKGTTIYNNKQTEELLNMLPRFSLGTLWNKGKEAAGKAWQGAKNVGGKVKNIAGKAIDYISNPSKIFEDLVSAVMPEWNIGGFMLDLGKGLWKHAKDALFGWMKDRFAEAGQGKKQGWMNKYPITTPYSPNKAVPGYPTSFNGGRHYGIDWGTPSGTNLTSPVAGKVKYQSDHGGGRVARVDYGKGAMYFLHMNSVKSGKVAIGESLGRSGNTGAYTTGPHVHVQDENPKTSFLQNRNTRDPLKMLKGMMRGGIIEKEGLFWGAEKNKPEAVIPLDGSNEMHRLFNYIAGKVAQTKPVPSGPVKSPFDTSKIEEKLDQLIAVMEQFASMKLNMNIDGKTIAESTFEDIDSLIAEKNKRSERFKGVTV